MLFGFENRGNEWFSGASGVAGLFSEEVLRTMSTSMPPVSCPVDAPFRTFLPRMSRSRVVTPIGDATSTCLGRPIVLPLSNPTSASECTFQDAYNWTDRAVVFASGSQFPPVQSATGVAFASSQANNSMIFPGLGTGAVFAGSSAIPDDFFLIAAYALAQETTQAELDAGLVIPPTSRIRDAALAVATAVAVNSSVNMLSSSNGNALLFEAVVLAARDSDGMPRDKEGLTQTLRLARVRSVLDSLRYNPLQHVANVATARPVNYLPVGLFP